MKVCVLDLETVPDYNVWTRPEVEKVDQTSCEKCSEKLVVDRKCPAMTRGKCRPAKQGADPKDVFPPRYAHRVICAGLASYDGETFTLGAASAPESADEPGLLSWLSETFGNFDRVVTWGGTRFDVPVIEMRSLHHGIEQKWMDGGLHQDLHDTLAPRWRNDDKINLDTISKLIGLPGKSGVDGSMVEAMAAAGNHSDIASYCLHDVVQTAYLWLRTCLLRGWCSTEQYKARCKALRAAWETREDFKTFKVKELP